MIYNLELSSIENQLNDQAEYIQQNLDIAKWLGNFANDEPINLSFLRNVSASYIAENSYYDFTIYLNDEQRGKLTELKLHPYLYGHTILAILLYKYTGQEMFWLKLSEGFSDSTINLISYNFTKLQTALEVINYSKSFNTLFNIEESDHYDTKIKYRINYSSINVDRSLLTIFADCYQRLFLAVLDDPKLLIKGYNLLSEAQYYQMVKQWNNTDMRYNNATIIEVFEQQVLKTPTNIAVICGDTKLTYLELNQLSNQLAHYLKDKAVIQSDSLISIIMDRSIEFLVSILATYKLGAAYMPIDPIIPVDRIKSLITEANPLLILSEKKYLSLINEIETAPPISHFIGEIEFNKYSSEDLGINIIPNSLAYIIYTSGSTGKPKGAMVQHKGMMNHLYSKIHDMEMSHIDKVAQTATQSFDVSFWQFISALMVGGTTVIFRDYTAWEPGSLLDLIEKEKVTIFQTVPSHMHAILPYIENSYKYASKKLKSLRWIIINGEPLPAEICLRWFNIYSNIPIINAYGPTECSDDVTHYKIFPDTLKDNKQQIMPINRTLPNNKLYIVDAFLNPLPIGAIGELLIGGDGVGRGYFGRPDLTAEKFIPNPFFYSAKNSERLRLYRSGDLVRYLPEGIIEFIGRVDHQIKIRGHRIELGEIENALASYQNIKQAIVLVKEKIDENNNSTNNKYLAAYFVKKNLNIEDKDIKDFIDTWEILYDSEYLLLKPDHFKHNVKGWNSSYDGKEIEKKYMLEWLEATANRIRELEPKVILEIGSGTGLLLFNLIDNCQYYYATELSTNAVIYINQVINKNNYKSKCSAFVSRADIIPYQDLDKDYDTLIINAAVQYFPNLDYLESVIFQAISNIKDEGKIFIGDVRDYRLLECFHYSVLLHKNQKVTKAEIEYFAKRDKELLIDPKYFIYLQSINSDICFVDIIPKAGEANIEMNNYRYDVILYINKSKNNNLHENRVLNESEFTKTSNFDQRLNLLETTEYVCIKYPNKRIIKDYNSFNSLYSSSEVSLESDNAILGINNILSKIKDKNYFVKFWLDIEEPLYLYCMISKGSQKKVYIRYDRQEIVTKTGLSNNPVVIHKLLDSKFISNIKGYLSNILPEYMLPEYYVPLEKMPLTINGKIDRKALPEPEYQQNENYVAPNSELEIKLCNIWAAVLGIPENKVGIRDNFFNLGGNSILAIKLTSKLNSELGTNIAVPVIFEQSTIEALMPIINNTVADNSKGVDYVF